MDVITVVPCMQIGGEVGMAEQEVKESRVWMKTVTEMNFHCAKDVVMFTCWKWALNGVCKLY